MNDVVVVAGRNCDRGCGSRDRNSTLGARVCRSKKPRTKTEAQERAEYLNKLAGDIRYGFYRCNVCGSWHIRHAANKPQAKRHIVLRLRTVAGVTTVIGYMGDDTAGAAAYEGVRTRADIPAEDGDYILAGALIFGSKGARAIVGQVRVAEPSDDLLTWKTMRVKVATCQ